jgi:hypothetical protein
LEPSRGPQQIDWLSSPDVPVHLASLRNRKVGCAADETPPSSPRVALPVPTQRGWPGSPRAGVGPIANFRSGRTRGRARARAPATASPRVPSRALTTSSLGPSVGGGPATLRPESYIQLPSPSHRLPDSAGPSPGKPGPQPRPLRAAAAPTPRVGRGATGTAGLQASWRPAALGARALGSAPVCEEPRPMPQGSAARLLGIRLQLCPSRSWQSLGDWWERAEICRGTPRRVIPGLHCYILC